MSDFSMFMKANKTVKENGFYAATKSLCDKDGNALEWEFKHITSKQNSRLLDDCTTEVQVTGKPNLFRSKTNNSKYVHELICASIVMPDLYNKDLQDSYGVKSPEDLLYAMVDDPGEYNDLAGYVQKFQGFNVTMDDKVEQAKN